MRRRSTRIESRPSLATIATRIDVESRRASVAVTSAFSTAAKKSGLYNGRAGSVSSSGNSGHHLAGSGRKFSAVALGAATAASTTAPVADNNSHPATGVHTSIELKKRMRNFFDKAQHNFVTGSSNSNRQPSVNHNHTITTETTTLNPTTFEADEQHSPKHHTTMLRSSSLKGKEREEMRIVPQSLSSRKRLE